MLLYSYLLGTFPLFVVIHTVKGLRVVNKAEINLFLEFSCFYYDPTDFGNLISGSSAFSKSSLNIYLEVHGSHIAEAYKEYNQSDFGIGHLEMSMYRVFSYVFGRGCLL